MHVNILVQTLFANNPPNGFLPYWLIMLRVFARSVYETLFANSPIIQSLATVKYTVIWKPVWKLIVTFINEIIYCFTM